MSFSLPNPTSPTNGQPLDATPILANLVAIEQAIDSFDGSQVQAKSVTEQALADAINPRLRGLETLANFVYTGCVWSSVSGLAGTMTSGTIYVNGYRVIVTAIGSETFPASNDTYVDIDYLGNVTYQSTSNGGSAPALTANALRVAKVITGSSTVSSVVQTGIDSNNVQIYPTSSELPANWKTYTPTLTGGSPSIGSTGTISGKYVQIGKTIHFQVQVTVGGSGISGGSGAYSVSLPITAQTAFVTANGNPFVGNTNLYQSSGTLNFFGTTQISSSTTAQVVLFTLTTVTTGAIFALGIWGSGVVGLATGNIITIAGTYEAA